MGWGHIGIFDGEHLSRGNGPRCVARTAKGTPARSEAKTPAQSEAGTPARSESKGLLEGVVGAHDWSISVTESDRGGARFEVSDVAVERP